MSTRSDGRKAACDHVARKFPNLAGVSPKAAQRGDGWVYTFDKTVAASPGGPKIRQIVHVTVDGSGRVKKVMASR